MSTEQHDKAVRGNDPASGMTIREHFAAMAMQGMLANPAAIVTDLTMEQTVELSIKAADALLAALEGDHD